MTNGTDFTDLPNLASERFGTVAVVANDEFFAPQGTTHQGCAAGVAAKACTTSAANGWTDGKRAVAGRRATIG